MLTDEIAAARRGAVLLDREEPGWAARIDVERLDMTTHDRCVLGQLYGGSFLRGLVRLHIPAGEADTHGFVPLCSSGRNVAAAWRAEIASRVGPP